MSVAGRRIVLGVSGGVAAYKAVEVCRRLMDAGAHVAPILTPNATKFIGAATFSAVATEPARISLYDNPGDPSPHTRLGQSADLIVVAPATARLLSSYATGNAEGLLVATLLATRAPVLVCPAMHTEMWEHPAVQDNLAILRRRGVHVLEPATGRLAGGDVGAGRLPDPAEIVRAAEAALAPQDLKGVRVLVTAGGTRESIDAVRVITNKSSGKQGHAIAEAAAARGASVTLVTTTDRLVPSSIERVPVASAAEMLAAVESHRVASDVIVMAAAVADFRPAHPAENKIKKEAGLPTIALEPTEDILRGLGAAKRPGQLLVGFAAETDDVVANATGKLQRKNLDLIVANDVSAPGVGFDHDTNAVTIVGPTGPVAEIPLSSKSDVARALLDAIVARLPRSNP
ncbi:MAG: bifunctional phosphopantothenoylcysteine decarboxylase/phosphopantothenate--cysteine ligase CoaBC [Acidimicrobiales bacterium]|nr:bifunctional phosphopantothenoylcysteine decarboxylase/phosphopantothenate--cysteine ligase CoaBC [Acidimicrobiales bacterium]